MFGLLKAAVSIAAVTAGAGLILGLISKAEQASREAEEKIPAAMKAREEAAAKEEASSEAEPVNEEKEAEETETETVPADKEPGE